MIEKLLIHLPVLSECCHVVPWNSTTTYKQLCNFHDYQVAEPLRAMVMGAPLEDARHLAQRYDRMRQEAEAQVFSYSLMSDNVVGCSTCNAVLLEA